MPCSVPSPLWDQHGLQGLQQLDGQQVHLHALYEPPERRLEGVLLHLRLEETEVLVLKHGPQCHRQVVEALHGGEQGQAAAAVGECAGEQSLDVLEVCAGG